MTVGAGASRAQATAVLLVTCGNDADTLACLASLAGLRCLPGRIVVADNSGEAGRPRLDAWRVRGGAAYPMNRFTVGSDMSSAYSTAKEVYFKIRTVPILGALLTLLSPAAKKIARKIDARKTPRGEVSKQIEILSQGVVSLQNSVNASLQRTQAQVQAQVADCRALVDGYRVQIDDYRGRLEFIRLEILEQCGSPPKRNAAEKARFKSKILSSEKYNAALAANRVIVNIGCGHKPIAGYLNVDRRNLPGVDIVAEAADLPFESGTILEIYTAHLIEHFTLSALKNTVFPYWLDMLAAQGILKIIVPDMPSMIAAYVHGVMTFSDLKEVTFGTQDYDDDFHYTMFSQQSLQSTLVSSGFKYIEIIDENRVNGKCREMEIWARKF